jgi:hypothetical protein
VSTELQPITSALVELAEVEFRALIAATQPPEAAIPPEEDAVSIDAAMLGICFAGSEWLLFAQSRATVEGR